MLCIQNFPTQKTRSLNFQSGNSSAKRMNGKLKINRPKNLIQLSIKAANKISETFITEQKKLSHLNQIECFHMES
jgi:hypothetical protein